MAVTLRVLALLVGPLRRLRFVALPVRLRLRTELRCELAAKAGVFGFAVNLDRSGDRVDPILTYFYRWETLGSSVKGKESR